MKTEGSGSGCEYVSSMYCGVIEDTFNFEATENIDEGLMMEKVLLDLEEWWMVGVAGSKTGNNKAEEDRHKLTSSN